MSVMMAVWITIQMSYRSTCWSHSQTWVLKAPNWNTFFFFFGHTHAQTVSSQYKTSEHWRNLPVPSSMRCAHGTRLPTPSKWFEYSLWELAWVTHTFLVLNSTAITTQLSTEKKLAEHYHPQKHVSVNEQHRFLPPLSGSRDWILVFF